MKLSKHELEFIIAAANMPEAVYDFQEAWSEEDFKDMYGGLSKKAAKQMIQKLAEKAVLEFHRQQIRKEKNPVAEPTKTEQQQLKDEEDILRDFNSEAKRI